MTFSLSECRQHNESNEQRTQFLHSHPCYIDASLGVNAASSSARRMAHQRRIRTMAQRIGQRRMILQGSINPREIAQDGSNVVHRTTNPHEDYDCVTCYTQVEFLNHHDIVLAGATDGRVDIVRLPRYQHVCQHDVETSFHENHDDTAAADNTHEPRPMGTLMAKNVHVGTTSAGSGCIKSFRDGHSYIMGYSTGEFVIHATEHSTRFNHLTSEASQQRLGAETKQLGVRGKFFPKYCRRNPGRRRFEYAESLGSMLESFALVPQSALYRWGYNGGPGQGNRWAFRETPSCIMGSFMEEGHNSFSLCLVDSRMISQDAHYSSSLACVVGASSDNGSSKLNQFYPTVGHVTSSCFVSDHCLATLHMWQQPSQYVSTTAVKIWDIRTASTSTSSQGHASSMPVAETDLSPTIHDASGNNATTTRFVELDNQVKWPRSPAQANLVPSVDDNGHFMASIVTNTDLAESYVLDATSASVLRKHCTRSAADSVNAITPSLDGLACYDLSSLSLYDFSKQQPLHDHKQRNESRQKGERKRSRDHDMADNEEWNDDCLIGTIVPTIEDEVGIRSRLSCLAFNTTGTSLVGGTDSGDLFLWRGG